MICLGARARAKRNGPDLYVVDTGQLTRIERANLQAFADQVEDEAHWQQLLASADEDRRADLERLVGPLLAFRRPRCAAPSCDSGLPPVYRPVLVVRKRLEDTPLYAPIEIGLCKTCKAQMRVGDAITDDIWTQIIRQCVACGYPVPDRALTALTFDRVQ